ncbi:inner membrane-spanning protein YciB [Lutibaculum baratangense]|uniref:Intracellular septation protein A n=1 Tax=Lutibaculum baratangense AMV1 TaxID=631454 RepID=V4RGM8_9HYPH|nr:septation protein IspZ [Lutibaculum baratangense]ESR24504.1 Intracellular septation protein A [Lutibaculum baratangense AMV1]
MGSAGRDRAAGTGVATKRIDTPKLLKRFAVELGPPLVFALALQMTDVAPAIGIFLAVTALSTLHSWFELGHFPRIPATLLAVSGVLGGLSIATGEEAFIEASASVINAGAAAALAVGLMTGRLFLKGSLQSGFRLRDEGWRALSLRMIAYLLTLAVVNEMVRRAVPIETWAWYKASIPVLNLLFLSANWPLIRRNLMPRSESEPAAAARGPARER